MQPYQQASEELQRQGQLPIRALKSGASIASSLAGGAVAGGGLALSKVAPFLSKYLPQDLAIKGLSKIDPRFGKFINNAIGMGKSFDDVKDFIGEKMESSQPPKENKNIIQQYSPELFQFIKGEMDKGRSPLEAGALASLQGPFKKVIKKLTQDHKAPFSSILQTVFGEQQPKQGQTMQPEQQQQGQQPQQGNVDAQLMAAFDKILKM